ncbi:hypothetical protein [Streptomyces sp. NPDC102462]|uniref:hypothetical protein n=1 Tax=Streptomyces sp. NPDC102462 TaxID=3366178 RepID=UPI0038280EC8
MKQWAGSPRAPLELVFRHIHGIQQNLDHTAADLARAPPATAHTTMARRIL